MQLKLTTALLALLVTVSGLAVNHPAGGNTTRPIGEDGATKALAMRKYCDTERLQTIEGARNVWIQSGAARELDGWIIGKSTHPTRLHESPDFLPERVRIGN
jgi:hypothetical protein